MKTKIALLLLSATTVVAVSYFFRASKQKEHIILFANTAENEDDEADARYKWELMRLADPATGKIPEHIRAIELAYAATLPKLESNSNERLLSTTPVFSSRGPWNVGGRTRAVAIDITNDSIILAGSVNGGLWRSIDRGNSWTRVSGKDQIPAISCLIQDARVGHTNVWYYGTGEGYGTSAGAAGAYYEGNGIYKSTDGGKTWAVLSSTYSTTPQTPDTFDSNWSLATDSSNHINDVLYSATVFYGIQMSIDGGTTWTNDLNTGAYFTDVKVSPTGIVYASASSDDFNGMSGLWRKQSSSWTKISPPDWDTTTFNRYVIDINPSNENEVYFLGGNTSNHGKPDTTFLGDVEWNSLWKYTYLSGNGSGSGGQWTDLSQNLPDDTNSIARFYTQGGYDLIVKVHPDSSNIVYIGGTNLYRSKDGFTTSNNTKLIGGYDPTSRLPFYRNYPGHHPDQHNIIFLPSNHDKMIQTNDGGIFQTVNNRADSVKWQTLNNGYITGQFYTVALDHGTVPNNIVLGGLQDNGSWFTNSPNITKPWTMPGNGDGSFCAIDDGHATYYMSRQQGATAKATLDTAGNIVAFRRMDPIDGLKRDDYLFINPFVIDPNNNNRMFMAAGSHIWRNDSLSSINLTNEWDSIRQGWFEFPDSVPGGRVVTSFALSKSPVVRLYYGTSQGKIYRVDNPYSSAPTPVEITGTVSNPARFPTGGYMNCIAVDPTDANKIIIVFTNYGIMSMFYSSNGGIGWKNIGGNLEPTDGSDVSIRWASIIPVSNGTVYLVGTSIGLFGTSQLDTTATVWTQLDPNGIGNMVVDMIDYRSSDGLVAVATHGGGVYTSAITHILGLHDLHSTQMSVNIYPNPASARAVISLTLSKAEMISLRIFNAKGELVETLAQHKLNEGEHQFIIERKNKAAGTYFINIKGENTNETCKIVFMN